MHKSGAIGRNRTTLAATVLAIGVAVTGTSRASFAQQFGLQARADAAQQMTVLAVQQGISSLPPTSGQSFSYKFDEKVGAFVPGTQLGPTSFRSPQTIGKGKWSVRLAGSYFGLEESFGPIRYTVEADEPFSSGPNAGSQPAGVAAFGLDASADVGLINLGVNYGILDWIEVNLNLPLVIVDVQADQISSTAVAFADLPASEAQAGGVFRFTPFSQDPATRMAEIAAANAAFDNRIDPGCTAGPTQCLTYRSDGLSDLGASFDDGTGVGVGRISLGGKFFLYGNDWVQLAFATDFFFPSPSEDELAGSESAAILPRLIGQVTPLEFLRLHMDAGYDYDFEEAELRRFTWNVGASVPWQRFTFDAGVGGSEFDVPIRWSPGRINEAPNNFFPAPTTLTALDDTSIGDNFIDFLGGIKFAVTDQIVVSGGVNVPLNNDGFRADAVGTGAVEFYF